MPENIPVDMSYCKIVGKFQTVLPDFDDADDLPDFSPMYGVGVITPVFDMVKIIEAGYQSHLFSYPIDVYVGKDGYLSQGLNKYVKVLAPSGAISVGALRYSISLTLRPVLSNEPEYSFGPLSFLAVPDETLDLADLT